MFDAIPDVSDGEEYEQPGSRKLTEDDKVPSTSRLDAFLSSRTGAASKGAKAAATKPSKQQLEAQEQHLQQQRLLERKMKKQFMSSKVRIRPVAAELAWLSPKQ